MFLFIYFVKNYFSQLELFFWVHVRQLNAGLAHIGQGGVTE